MTRKLGYRGAFFHGDHDEIQPPGHTVEELAKWSSEGRGFFAVEEITPYDLLRELETWPAGREQAEKILRRHDADLLPPLTVEEIAAIDSFPDNAVDMRRLPAVSERVETGAIQFGDDWPGLFLRGDHAAYLSACITVLLRGLSEDADYVAVAQLRNVRDVIEGAVIMRHRGSYGSNS